MNKDLKVGDKVYLSEDTIWNTSDAANPLDVEGVVLLVMDTGVTKVEWSNGHINVYRPLDSDLIPEKEYLESKGISPYTKDDVKVLSFNRKSEFEYEISLSIQGLSNEVVWKPTITFDDIASNPKPKPEPKFTPKVIITYTNGKTYTYKNVSVDCWVSWEDMTVSLLDHETPDFVKEVRLTEDTLSVESVDEFDGSYWLNPKYKSSAKVDIKTNRKRCKDGQTIDYSKGTPLTSHIWNGVLFHGK